jgi:hypothetical protein
MYRSDRDNTLIAELYSGSVRGELLLETPVTKANIERFIKKYFSVLVSSNTSPDPDQIERLRVYAKEFLDNWTPRLQQIIKAAGGNPDIFAYTSISQLNDIIANSQTSKTDEKKAYKKAGDTNIPVIKETDTYIAYQPLNWEASRKYFGETRISLLDGETKKGATWCTSASTPKHFNEYVVKNRNRLLYFIRKKDDKLFAARSMRTDLPGAVDKSFNIWLKKVGSTMKRIERITGSKGYAEAKKLKDKWQIRRFDYEISTYLRDLQPPRNYETRNQKNGHVFGLLNLFGELEPRNENIADYINFVAFVVFNKELNYEIPSN